MRRYSIELGFIGLLTAASPALAADAGSSLSGLELFEAARPEIAVSDVARIGRPRTGIAPSATRVRITSSATDAVDRSARAHGIDPALLRAVIMVESRARPDAVSPKGARGLMQLMPDTARRVGLRDAALLADPEVNIEAGARELRRLHARLGSLPLVLAAYNAGQGAVARFHGVPPFRETTAYVARVTAQYRRLAGAAS